jgi:hypothetical protein
MEEVFDDGAKTGKTSTSQRLGTFQAEESTFVGRRCCLLCARRDEDFRPRRPVPVLSDSKGSSLTENPKTPRFLLVSRQEVA